jgi:hypothetical protein
MYCRRITGDFPVDGRLDATFWRAAEPVQLRLYNGGQPTHRTLVRTLWSTTRLYVGFECEDPEPTGTMTQRDAPLFEDGNVVEMFLDPQGTGQTYFEFEVNPLGTLMDLFFDRLDRDWHEAVRWNSDAISGAQIQFEPSTGIPIGWTAELSVPFKDFHTARPPRCGDIWRANFCRYNTYSELPGDKLELYTWSSTMEKRFGLPHRFGYLEFVS